MSVITVERPAPPAEPEPSWLDGWWNRGLRLVLLGVLVVAAAVALPSTRPHASSVNDYLDDLKGDRVSSVRYVASSVEVRWSRDWSHWYHASLQQYPLPTLPSAPDGVVVGDAPDGTSDQWLQQSLHATGHPGLDFGIIDDSGAAGRLPWTDQLPNHTLSAWAGAAAFVGFVLMLFRRQHRFGNRWAWFWVMLATSGLGTVLYLALEPSPLWHRPSRSRPLPQRPAFLGGAGFLLAIALGPAVSLLRVLVAG